MKPLSTFATEAVFTPTSGASVAKLKQLGNQYFVKQVTTLEQALACGAVFLMSGSSWVVLSRDAVLKLQAAHLWPCTIRLAPSVDVGGTDAAWKSRPLFINGGYTFEALADSDTIYYAGLVTRAQAVIGWNSMVGNPFVAPPKPLNLPLYRQRFPGATDAADFAANLRATKPVLAEVAYLDHPFGVVDLFNRQETQAKLDEWSDGARWREEASALIRAEQNLCYPTPVLHIWTPDFHYFGPGQADEVRHVRAPYLNDEVYDRVLVDFPALSPSRVASIYPFNTYRSEQNEFRKWSVFPLDARQGEFNTNTGVVVSAKQGANVDGVIVSGCVWGAPAACHAYLAAPAISSFQAVHKAASAGASTGTAALHPDATIAVKVFEKGPSLGFLLPWIAAIDPFVGLVQVRNRPGTIPSPWEALFFSDRDWHRSAPLALPNTGVPSTISGEDAKKVLGAAFLGSYYGLDLEVIPPTGIEIASKDLIAQAAPALTIEYNQAAVDTTGLTAEQAASAKLAADTAYVKWDSTRAVGIETAPASEKWVYSMMDAFADLMVRYYEHVERLAKAS